MDNYYDYLLKIVIIGNTCVGKSAILKRFCESYLNHIYNNWCNFRVVY